MLSTDFKTDYTNTDLLNDFNHIKYDHNADDDDMQFFKIFELINNDIDITCDPQKCKDIKRRYNRSKYAYSQNNEQNGPQNDYNELDLAVYQQMIYGNNQLMIKLNKTQSMDDNFNKEYSLKLIERIHVYFIHSYDINRLTLNETEMINKQIKLEVDEKQQIESEYKKIALISEIINKKKMNLNISSNHDKYIEGIIDTKFVFFDFKQMHQILKREHIQIEETQIRETFGKYNDKNTFITDIIDAYHLGNDDQLSLENKLSNKLKCDQKTRNKIYECILYKYIKKDDLNNMNFIKISSQIMLKSYPEIDTVQFAQIATKSNINGTVFIKGTKTFKNCLKFAKLFQTVHGYNKKNFAAIYMKINQWIPPKVKPLEPGSDHNEHSEPDETEEKNDIDIYDVGLRYYYWKSMKYHKHYIKKKHPTLKEEMLQNKIFKFDIKRWWALYNETENDLKTDIVKHMKSNGFYQKLYKITKSEPFSIQHLLSLKLYTDYTNECNLFCSILRSENTTQIKEITNWAKLLSECVQCYGFKLKKKKKYYRGLSTVFNFKMLAMRFCLPTSTSIDVHKACQFCNGTGLVLELRQYGNRYDVFKLDCAKLSGFSEEKETLFFGGNTVLRISSILEAVGGKWLNYRQYMEPMDSILRMINGLTIKNHNIILHDDRQQTMNELIHHVFYEFNAKKSCTMLPDYINQMLKNNMSNDVIKLDFVELKNKYKWMASLFLKKKQFLNISNIGKLFCNSNEIIFLMPKDYIFSYSECVSLIREDLKLLSAMDININITFLWPEELPIQNKERINEYQHNLSVIHWKRTLSTNCVTFEVIDGESITVQWFIESKQAQNDLSNSVLSDNTVSPFGSIDKSDIALNSVLFIHGFIRIFENDTNVIVPQQIVDLILFMYAKPVMVKFTIGRGSVIDQDSVIYQALLHLDTDSWDDFGKRLFIAAHGSGYGEHGSGVIFLKQLETKYGTIEYETRDDFDSFKLRIYQDEVIVATFHAHAAYCCIDGEGLVAMMNGEYKRVCDLVVGDQVISFPNNISSIECCIKDKVNQQIEMVQLFNCVNNSNFWITPQHPIFVNNDNSHNIDIGKCKNLKSLDVDYIKEFNLKWVLPKLVCPTQLRYQDNVFNFMLDSHHTMNVNGYWCCSLGDGYFKGNNSLGDGYEFWSNYEKIKEYLQSISDDYPQIVIG